jgi:hypothetical protein
MWDIGHSHPFKTFYAHTYPIVSIHQPNPQSYEEICKKPYDTADDIDSDIRSSSLAVPKYRHGSLSLRKSVPEDIHHIREKSSEAKYELHSATHRQLQSFFRSFYAISSDGTVIVLDWIQNRIAWWLNGIPSHDLPVSISCFIPAHENSHLWCLNPNITFEDLNINSDDGSVVIRILGNHSCATWLVGVNGAICLTFNHKLSPDNPILVHTHSMK